MPFLFHPHLLYFNNNDNNIIKIDQININTIISSVSDILHAIVGRETDLGCAVCASGSTIVAVDDIVVALFLIFIACASKNE